MSAGACTLQVYGDHLYIGDYNDVSSALQGFVTKSNFVTQATNLEQSVNLYRMDKNDTFPKGGSTGLGSGYDNHMNQYTWQTTVHEGKMYLSTMNTTTLLEPIAQFTNGDILNMNEKDWNNTVHYLRVFLRLLWGMGPTDPASAIATQSNDQNAKVTTQTMPSTDNPEALVDWARIQAGKDASAAQPQTTDAKSVSSAKPISLTATQTKELVDGIKDGSIVPQPPAPPMRPRSSSTSTTSWTTSAPSCPTRAPPISPTTTAKSRTRSSASPTSFPTSSRACTRCWSS